MTASPLDKRLVFVTGKGGTGKSTVAAALGLAAAHRGRRTIVAEVARRDDVSRALRGDIGAGFEEVELAPGLFSISIDPQRALEEYLIDQLPVRALADVLTSSRMFAYLAAATPGLRELVSVGKVWELAQPTRRTPGAEPYDLVVVDAPATGHGLALLAAPQTFSHAAGVGPIARQARTIHTLLADPQRTGVLAVATAQEAAVTETLELARSLRRQMDLGLDRVVVNALTPARFAPREAARLRALLAQTPEPRRERASSRAVSRRALEVALAEHHQQRAEHKQVARLRRGLGLPPVSLPFLFGAELGPPELEQLSGALERAL